MTGLGMDRRPRPKGRGWLARVFMVATTIALAAIAAMWPTTGGAVVLGFAAVIIVLIIDGAAD